MRASTVGSTLLLLASAVVAQTTEGVLTIQTSTPTGTATCYEVCVQEPCYACSATPTDGDMTLPVVSIPPPVEGTSSYMIPRPSPRPSVVTSEGMMSIPAGETPESTGDMATTTAQSTSGSSSATSSAPAQASTAAASLPLKHDGTQYLVALGVSGVSVLLGAAFALL